ncbi:MAG: trimeric intracellular cation channel family protein [Eubacteriales bacterium]
MELFIFIFAIIGTAAFAVSGAMTGVAKKMDIFGVCILGLTTATGGGMIRDVVLGVTPPAAFRDPVYAVISIAVSVVVFFVFRRHKSENKFSDQTVLRLSRHRVVNFESRTSRLSKPPQNCTYGTEGVDMTMHEGKGKKAFDLILLVTDSAGLGIFTVCGVRTAIECGYISNHFLVLFVAVVTGVGGGVLRDIFAGDRPYIFVKHIYACASLIGALAAMLVWIQVGQSAAMLIGFIVVTAIRLLAARFRWSLPKA